MVPRRRPHRQASLGYVHRASFQTFSMSKCIRDPTRNAPRTREHTSWDGSQDVYNKEAKPRNTSGHQSPGSVGVCYRGDGFIPPYFVQNTQMRQKMEKDKDNTGCGASQRRATLAKNTPSGLCDWLSTEDHPGGAEPPIIHLPGLERPTTARGSNKIKFKTPDERAGTEGEPSRTFRLACFFSPRGCFS